MSCKSQNKKENICTFQSVYCAWKICKKKKKDYQSSEIKVSRNKIIIIIGKSSCWEVFQNFFSVSVCEREKHVLPHTMNRNSQMMFRVMNHSCCYFACFLFGICIQCSFDLGFLNFLTTDSFHGWSVTCKCFIIECQIPIHWS